MFSVASAQVLALAAVTSTAQDRAMCIPIPRCPAAVAVPGALLAGSLARYRLRAGKRRMPSTRKCRAAKPVKTATGVSKTTEVPAWAAVATVMSRNKSPPEAAAAGEAGHNTTPQRPNLPIVRKSVELLETSRNGVLMDLLYTKKF
jgi:hypothetical protein